MFVLFSSDFCGFSQGVFSKMFTMNTTIEAICYKYKPLKNNEFPIKLRITQNRKRRYINLGVSTRLEDWDLVKNRPKPNCPDREYIEQIISDKITEYRSKILELKSTGKEFTPTSLISQVDKRAKLLTVRELFIEHISNLKSQKRTGYALTFTELHNSLMLFNGHLDIYFSDIDISWLKRYETWLKGQGIMENTIGKRFRTLRVLYNLAIEEGIVKKDHYPFKAYKVSKLHQATAKRAISKEEITRVINYQSDRSYTRLAIDLFTFGYFMGGINFVDIAYLKPDNIVDGRLVYIRRKTHKLIRLPMQPKAQEIIERYHNNGALFLFPIFSDFHKTEKQQRNRVHKVITKVNKRLNDVGKELELPIDLTTYVARHSFATVLKRSGVSTSIICESMGHSSEKVTQYYLDSFENSQIDEAMQNLL